jgi:hypothetical protein
MGHRCFSVPDPLPITSLISPACKLETQIHRAARPVSKETSGQRPLASPPAPDTKA